MLKHDGYLPVCSTTANDQFGKSIPNEQSSDGGNSRESSRRSSSRASPSEVQLAKEDGSSKSETESSEDNGLHLKRGMGLISGTALIVGTMIGSGIFVSPKGLLERTGSVGLSLVIWVMSGVLCMLGAISYTELGTLLPYSGAEYYYFMEAFGSFAAFFYCWVSVLILKPAMLSIICLSFAEYVAGGLNSTGCGGNELEIKVLCGLTIGFITFINCWDVELATRIQNIFTGMKLLAIAVIIVGGMVMLGLGNTQHIEKGFEGSTTSFGDIATAFYSGLWAYDGWNQLNYVTEELKDPSKNLPRGIMIGIPLVIVCYFLVNISYLAVMSPTELLQSEAVAITFGNRILGPMAWLIPVSVAVSTFGAANGTAFISGRLCFVGGREGHLIKILSYVHIHKLTPTPALLFNSLISLVMISLGDISSLIDFFGFTAWIFYGGAMLALIVMRRTKKNDPRPFKVPIIIPWLVLLISAYLVVAPIIDQPQIEYLYATIFMMSSLLFYIPFVHYKISFRFMDTITMYLQLILEVAPSKGLPKV